MTKHHFSFKEIFVFGWEKTLQHAWFVFLSTIIITALMGAVSHAFFINFIVCLMAGLSIASISLLIVRNHSFTFMDLVNPVLSHKRVLKFFALVAFYIVPAILLSLTSAVLVMGVTSGSTSAVLFGFILTVALLVPTFYVAVRFKFFPYVVIEHENASVSELILKSYKLTENNFWALFCFMLLALILNIFGLMFFIVGLFITVPVTIFATAHLYDRFKNHTIV